jgi:hypothetical protein
MSKDKPSYLWAAFNARPFGMPIPPNWFGLAALGMMGVFLSPGFLVLGAGLEIAYLAALSTSRRFRNVVDAGALQQQQIEDPADRRYREMLEKLALSEQRRQQQVEARAREILAMLKASPMMSTHADSLEQLVWLHLRLLSARQAIARVVQTAQQERAQLAAQEEQIRKRLESTTIGVELRRSLEQQVAVIDQRQEAHQNADDRLEHVEAELSRIDQQVALIREQALLATDEGSIGSSLNALTASFNEANRWLNNQRDLLGVFETTDYQRLPQRVLSGGARTPVLKEGESS